MSSQNYSSLNNKLLPCQKNKVFLSNNYEPRLRQSSEYYDTEVINTSSTAIRRQRFIVDIVSETEDMVLYEGTLFQFNGKDYYLAQQIELKVGIPAIDVRMESLETQIVQNNNRGILRYIYPYFSVNSIVQQEKNEFAEGNVFSGGFGLEKFLHSLDCAYELSGGKVKEDIGYEILAECRNTGKAVDVQFVDSFMQGIEEFQAICISIDRVIDRGDFFQLKVLLAKLI